MTQQRPALIIDISKYYGGADVRVFSLAEALHRQQYPFHVAALDGSPLHERLSDANLPVLPVPHTRSDPRLITFLMNKIREQGYQVVDAHNPQSQFWGHMASRLSSDIIRISTIHSAYGPEHDYSLKGRAYEQVLNLNKLMGCEFIAVTAAVRDYLIEQNIPAERIALIFNSLALPVPAGNGKQIPLMQELGWTDDHFVLTIVARLEPVKAHTTLIEAMQQVAPDYPQLRCLIVGDGRLDSDLKAQVQQANLESVIHFAGFRKDINKLLEASDAFTLPSLSEGLPYALLEAAGNRLPLLVSDAGGMAELLEHQQTGYLAKPGDAVSLADGIRWLLDNPPERDRIAQAVYDLIAEKFSIERMVSQTLSVYNPV